MDNIDSLSPSHQLELLPFLEKDDNPILDIQAPVAVDVCMIFSTNQNLEKMIKDGKFNERLYFRLKMVTSIKNTYQGLCRNGHYLFFHLTLRVYCWYLTTKISV